jgi:hypothetical protein
MLPAMDRTCEHCRVPFAVSAEEQAFLAKMTFRFGDTVIHPAQPVYCPECRLRIRTCHRNERFLYRVREALTGKDTVSIYHAEALWGAPYKIYGEEEWRSDAMDPLQYGLEIDPGKSFVEQWSALHKAVPRLRVINLSNENSEYVTGTAFSKNCYLTNSTENSEDCYYGKLLQRCKNAVDCAYLYDSEICYECFSCTRCYQCTHLSYSQDCTDCHVSAFLSNCTNCCLCVNLHRKTYHFLNEPLSKEEYEKKVAALRSHGMTEEYKEKLRALQAKAPHRFAQIVNCEDCSGDCVENSQRCHDCYDVTDSQDCRNVHVGIQVKDLFDCCNMYLKCELCYEVLGAIETFNVAYCLFLFHSRDMLCCEYCFFCSDCFGCVGLTRKRHCIYNRQYTEEEYNRLVPQLIERMQERGEWGKFFPPSCSPFGYNETLAQEYLPLTKEEAIARGFLWREMKDAPPQVSKVIPGAKLPDTIDAVPDEVLQWAITSERSGRPFRIVRQELDFYRRLQLPLPHLHPDERYDDRTALRNPRRLWNRECSHCKKPVESTFSPDRPETILCEVCYRETLY